MSWVPSDDFDDDGCYNSGPACGLAADIVAAENANPDATGPHAPYMTHPTPKENPK